ncbi:Uncharacterised protein [Leminorella richardii]|uniref:Uncharacterized protein n=1 Tax=Leminorella richardii TaxID=158841 RepID=A0A2X4UEC9_9GAMM|nr:hypothetical protein [Leminorella richardii]SQI37029.1 Uncharacterised protein [Leminorella richardii]
MKKLPLAALLFIASASTQAAPTLDKTRLFTELTSGCHSVQIPGWQNPALAVFDRFAITVTSAQLCNADEYPVFYVSLKYDPQGQTQDFYQPFYQAMKEALNGKPYSMVSDLDEMTIGVSYSAEGSVKTEFERYQAQ